ncbi:MAG: cytochrome P450 [Myxococcales bacterium]|nr:cytochrome P450 [Myxococcales bacterium]
MARLSLFPLDRPVPELPLVGHAPAFAKDPLLLITRLAREQGGVASLRMGRLQLHLVSEPELVGEVLVTQTKRYTRQTPVYLAMREFLGKGILTTEGEDWRVHRRIVQPAFHKKRLESFTTAIAKIAEDDLARWRGELDVAEAMMRVTLRIVSEVLLGTRTAHHAEAIGRAIDDSQRYVEGVMSQVVPIPRWLPTPRNRLFERSLEVLDRVAYEIIDERRRSGERGDDVVSMLLEARYEDGTPLTRERIRNELVTLLAAGHETTSNALSWTSMRLSQHPDVARRVAAEVAEVIGDRAPTFDDLGKLVYTRWVFDEAMRLHPPVWVTGRLAVEDHELSGRSIARGEVVLVSPYVTQRRPDLWDNPEGFDPDRWAALTERGALPPFTFYPFGGGTRKCVGEAFAYLEAMILLAMIAQRMRLELVPGHPIVPLPQITMGFVHGLRMQVRAPWGAQVAA